MFELNELPKQKVKIYGKEYDVTKPTVRQLKIVQTKLTGEASSEEMIKFISDLGVP